MKKHTLTSYCLCASITSGAMKAGVPSKISKSPYQYSLFKVEKYVADVNDYFMFTSEI